MSRLDTTELSAVCFCSGRSLLTFCVRRSIVWGAVLVDLASRMGSHHALSAFGGGAMIQDTMASLADEAFNLSEGGHGEQRRMLPSRPASRGSAANRPHIGCSTLKYFKGGLL